MVTVSATATPLTAEHAIAVVKRLPPAELRKFNRQLSAWQQQEQKPADEEAPLLARIQENSRLPATVQRRFNRLRRKRQTETLTAAEGAELQGLWQQVERMNVERLEALHQLAQRRGTKLRTLMREFGFAKQRDVF
ncbi:MAG: hypothetical protein ACRD2L_15920 [Terriglobia bacterium]